MDQTLPYTNKTSAVLCIPLTFMLTVGTGEILTREACKLREGGSRFDYHSPANGIHSTKSAGVVSPADDIAHIRSVLKASVTDLAQCIGVSRQALYNWKAGSNIKDQNLLKVAQLKAAADVVLEEGISASPLVINRKLPGGKTMLEAIAEGADGRATAMALTAMLRDEATNRRVLNERFATRLATAPQPSEYGVPAFDERG